MKKIFRTMVGFLALCVGCQKGDRVATQARPTDSPIVPGYIVKPGNILVSRIKANKIEILVPPLNITSSVGSPESLYLLAWSSPLEALLTIKRSPAFFEKIEGGELGSTRVNADGSCRLEVDGSVPHSYLVLFVSDRAGNVVPLPLERRGERTTVAYTSLNSEIIPAPRSVFELEDPESAQLAGPVLDAAAPARAFGSGTWISPSEIASLSMVGQGWTVLSNTASQSISSPQIGDPGDTDDSTLAAAGILYARDPILYASLKSKVVSAIDALVAAGKPSGSNDGFSKNIPGWVLAAELVSYQSAAFSEYLKNMAEVWRPSSSGDCGLSGGNCTFREKIFTEVKREVTFNMAALVSIYSYLGENENVKMVASRFRDLLMGTYPEHPTSIFRKDLSWAYHPSRPTLINPKGAMKLCEGSMVNVDGVLPMELISSGACRDGTATGRDSWNALQGITALARMLERQGMSVWEMGDRAILRAVSAMEDRFGNSALLSDNNNALWVLSFIDQVYGSRYSCKIADATDDKWRAGRAVGFAWILGPNAVDCR